MSKKVKFYVVRSSFDGQPEFLFKIAERFLGDGNRNGEIFDLNVGRLQPDGKRMTTASVLEPGWILQLPDDAKGQGIAFGVLPTFKATTDPRASRPPAPSAPLEAADKSVPDSGSLLPWGLGAAVVLIACLAVGLLLLRRRQRQPAGAGSAPPVAAVPSPRLFGWRSRGKKGQPAAAYGHFDTAASWTIDRALHSLATACSQGGRALPNLYAVTLDSERVILQLAAPDSEAPAPWTVRDNGRSWEASLRSLQGAPVDTAVAVPPLRLVTLGTADGSRVLLDLGQATGVIRLDGEAADLRALMQAWATELTTSPWSDGVRIVLSGLGDGPAGPRADGRVTSVSNTRDALTEIAVAEGTTEGPSAEMLRGSRQGSREATPCCPDPHHGALRPRGRPGSVARVAAGRGLGCCRARWR